MLHIAITSTRIQLRPTLINFVDTDVMNIHIITSLTLTSNHASNAQLYKLQNSS